MKVIGIFACGVAKSDHNHNCDIRCDDLLSGFAKLGAHAVIGPKFSPSALLVHPLIKKASIAFWKTLAGKRKPPRGYKEPSVKAATHAAADEMRKDLTDFGITGVKKFYPKYQGAPVPEDVVIYR